MKSITSNEAEVTLKLNGDFRVYCYDDDFDIEVETSRLDVWTEAGLMRGSFYAVVNLVHQTKPNLNATLTISEPKFEVRTVMPILDYKTNGEYVSIDVINADDEEDRADMYEVLTKHLDMDLKIDSL